MASDHSEDGDKEIDDLIQDILGVTLTCPTIDSPQAPKLNFLKSPTPHALTPSINYKGIHAHHVYLSESRKRKRGKLEVIQNSPFPEPLRTRRKSDLPKISEEELSQEARTTQVSTSDHLDMCGSKYRDKASQTDAQAMLCAESSAAKTSSDAANGQGPADTNPPASQSQFDAEGGKWVNRTVARGDENTLYSVKVRPDDGSTSVHAKIPLAVGTRIINETPLFFWDHFDYHPNRSLYEGLVKISPEAMGRLASLGWTKATWQKWAVVEEVLRKKKGGPLPPHTDLQSSQTSRLMLISSMINYFKDAFGKTTTELCAPDDDTLQAATEIFVLWEANRRFIEGNFDLGSFCAHQVALIRHSCRPNAFYTYNMETGKVTVSVTQPIEPGQEITISYLNQMMMLTSLNERQEALGAMFGITCQQPCCLEPWTEERKKSLRDMIEETKYIMEWQDTWTKATQHAPDMEKLKENVKRMDSCIRFLESEKLIGQVITFRMLKVQALAMAHRTQKAFDLLEKEYYITAQLFGMDDPWTRKLQMAMKRCFARRKRPVEFLNIIQFYSGTKSPQPLNGAPANLRTKIAEQRRSYAQTARFTTAAMCLEMPHTGLHKLDETHKAPDAFYDRDTPQAEVWLKKMEEHMMKTGRIPRTTDSYVYILAKFRPALTPLHQPQEDPSEVEYYNARKVEQETMLGPEPDPDPDPSPYPSPPDTPSPPYPDE